jgi:hydroxypyruvate isomerase
MTNRRDFILSGLISAGMLSISNASTKTKYHLRYAPSLEILDKELKFPQRIEFIAQNGFDATEYNWLMGHSLKEAEEIRKSLDKYGVEMGIFVANPGGWDKSGLVNPDQRDAFLDEIKKAIQYHKIIGNRSATTLTGPAMPGVSRSKQRRSVIEGLKRAADLLQQTNLALVIEPLNPTDHPGFFMVNSDELAEIVATVNSPNVKMLFDFYHLQISEGNVINNFRSYYDLIGYVQLGDVPGRKEPGTGEMNYRNIFKAIHEKGYKGILGMEHGTSVPGRAGILKMFEAYRQADNW